MMLRRTVPQARVSLRKSMNDVKKKRDIGAIFFCENQEASRRNEFFVKINARAVRRSAARFFLRKSRSAPQVRIFCENQCYNGKKKCAAGAIFFAKIKKRAAGANFLRK